MNTALGTVIAVASGKGGTGKTTVAVNLLQVCGQPAQILDCDVEEPNTSFFLKPQIIKTEVVSLQVPQVDESKCTGCGLCARICRYRAIAVLGNKPLVFPEMCHSCGGCALVCPTGAISEVERPIGVVEIGRAGNLEFVQGRLNISEVLTPPLIRAVKRYIQIERLTIIDCPPGTSCPMIAAVRNSNMALLVTEPTPFGLHDLKLAVETVRKLKIPMAVVVNRVGLGDNNVQTFCHNQQIPILLEIPEDRRIAEACSKGNLIVEALPEYLNLFESLLLKIMKFLKEVEV
jgi:MinD superfamily P-loop ATPase